jgi:hypothetical protein
MILFLLGYYYYCVKIEVKMIERVARIEDKINVCRILIGTWKGKRSLRRARRRWQDDIEVDLK